MPVKGQGLDGRTVRGLRNRDAIVQAMLALYGDGTLRPTAQTVAERAGLSLRAVYQHFADLEALREAVADAQMARVAALVEPVDPALPLAERIDRLVAQRARTHELVTPVRRAALLSVHDSPTIARRLRAAGRRLRGELEQAFAAELTGRPPELLEALDLTLSWDAWHRLRDGQGLSVTRARAVLRHQTGCLLAGAPAGR